LVTAGLFVGGETNHSGLPELDVSIFVITWTSYSNTTAWAECKAFFGIQQLYIHGMQSASDFPICSQQIAQKNENDSIEALTIALKVSLL